MTFREYALLAFAAVALSCSPAAGQQAVFPTKPIRMIVPFPPASAPDVLARLVGESVSAQLRQPVVVENKPGAGGMIGTDAGAKAQADGYTLLVGDSGPLAIAPWLYTKVPYTAGKDFVAVASLATIPIVLIVPQTSPTASTTELVKLAKARPKHLLYGSLGVGSIHHLAAELLSTSTGIQLTHIPYKSNGELAAAIVNGDVQMAFSALPSVEAFIKSSRMRAIAVSTAKRLPVMPEVKTVQEQGVAEFDVAPTIGIVAPIGVPADRLKILEHALLGAMADPKLLERMDGLGMAPLPATGQKYQTLMAQELERYGRIVKAAGIQPQ